MAIFSCSKEATVNPIFVEKDFFIENPETATAKVLEFLSYTDLTVVTLRSNYPDTEVNEGLWTLEASRNYIDNGNLRAKSDETVNYTLSIANTVDNNVIKMSGADMTAKFNELNANITTENTNGKTAKIVDFELQNVSAQQTDLTIGVVYSLTPPPPPPPAGCEDWPITQDSWEAGETLADCLLNHTIGYAWYQTVTITGVDDIFNCTDPELTCQCTWEGVGDTMDPDKFDEAYLSAQDMVDCLILDSYGPPSGNESNQHGTTVLLVDILLLGNTLGFNSAIFCEEIILGRGIPI